MVRSRSRKDRGRRGRRGRDSGGGSDGGASSDGGGGPAGLGSPRSARAALDRFPGWAAPVLFAVVTVITFREFIFSNQMLLGMDTLALGYMARAFFAEALATTGFPLWNPVILGGTPFLESLAGGDSLYPPSLLLLLGLETYRALGWKLVLHVFLAGWFMYAWLRLVGCSRAAGTVGGLSFLLAPYMVSLVYPGHDGKIFVTALTPLLFWACEWFLTRRDFVAASAIGAVVALVILTTHFQMAYFLFGAVGAYMIFRTVQRGRAEVGWAASLRHFGIFLAFSVIGAGAAGIQLLPAVDYVTEDSRRAATTLVAEPEAARAYSSSWSLHPEEVVSLVVPEFVGNDAGGAEWADGTYWGRNPFKLNHEYLGLMALLLAALSFLGAPARGLRWFLVGMGSVTLLFTLGANTPVWRLFFEAVPGISLFRAPSMAIFLTGFAVATLAGFGLDRGVVKLAEGEGRRVVRILGIAAAVLGVGWLLAATGALTGLWTSVFPVESGSPRAQGLEAAGPFIARGFFFAAVLAGLTCLAWWATDRRHLPLPALVAALLVLVGIDQIRVNDAFVQTIDYALFASQDANDRFLVERSETETPFRVFSMVQGGQDVRPGMYGIDLVGGHHPNDLLRYRELIGMEGSDFPEHLVSFNSNLLRILNVRYVLWPDVQYGPLQGVDPVSRVQTQQGVTLSSVYPFPELPRARVVGEALVVPEERSVETILDLDVYDPSRQVVMTEAPPIELGGPGVEGRASWIERTPNRLVLEVEASGPALLVLSENWFPAWEAAVDGEVAPVLRADHTLRAVPVPEGRHTVEMWYGPSTLRAGFAVSAGSILILLAAAGTGMVLNRRRESDGDGG